MNAPLAPKSGRLRVGRIGYLNVLPIYHPLEQGFIPNDFEFFYGPPAALNTLMARGGLELSSVSSIEYGRRPEQYYLLPDLAIGSRGPVMSVLLLSRVPPAELSGATILVSAQTHTSAALLKVLLTQRLGLTDVRYQTGDATAAIQGAEPPLAFLAIGDEALSLRARPDYPHRWDLGEAWREWTGAPFIFGVWVARRGAGIGTGANGSAAWKALLRGKEWGQAHMEAMASQAARGGIMSEAALRRYFSGLVYDLGPEEQAGLRAFYQCLVDMGELSAVPELVFAPER